MIEADLLRAELERLYELDELVSLSRDILGFDPEHVGGTAAKASFAGALTSHCVEQDAVEALCDVLLATRANVSSRVADIRLTGVYSDEELKPGADFAGFKVVRKLGEGRLALSYVVKQGDRDFRLAAACAAAVARAGGLKDRRLGSVYSAVRCLPTMPASSNIVTCGLPNTGSSLASALMARLLAASCSPSALM